MLILMTQKLKKDPYTTTLGGFSKVTNYIFDAFRAPELEQRERPEEEVADILGEIIPGLEISQLEEPGFEVITRVRGGIIVSFIIVIILIIIIIHYNNNNNSNIVIRLFILLKALVIEYYMGEPKDVKIQYYC